jgi:hypothetical protein
VSTRTRRIVFLAALFVIITIPAESILLRALIQPSEQVAVQDWVSNLDNEELATVSDAVQLYPFLYRKEIMRRLTPEGRSRVWRRHVESFIASRPDLDDNTLGLLKTVSRLLTPEYLSQPTESARASVHAVAEQIQTALGRDDAEFVLYTLGPRDGTFASFEPLAMFLTNKVRGFIQANAATPNCNCATSWGCYSGDTCSTAESCSTDSSWPACGWAWSDPCDGMCQP